MRIEFLPGMTNVVRFPLELRTRPTLEHMRDIAPDIREVLNLAEQFGMEPPLPDLREQTDRTTAEYIALQLPADGPERAAMLRDLEKPVVRRAIEACRTARDASVASAAAEAAWERAVVLMLEAHARVEEAEGVARAVAFARRGETWLPRDHAAATDALIALGAAFRRRYPVSPTTDDLRGWRPDKSRGDDRGKTCLPRDRARAVDVTRRGRHTRHSGVSAREPPVRLVLRARAIRGRGRVWAHSGAGSGAGQSRWPARTARGQARSQGE